MIFLFFQEKLIIIIIMRAIQILFSIFCLLFFCHCKTNTRPDQSREMAAQNTEVPQEACFLHGMRGVGPAIATLKSYEVIHQECGNWKLIRKMQVGTNTYYTAVHQESLETQIIHESCFQCPADRRVKSYTALNRILGKSTQPPYPLQNDGLSSVQNSGLGQVISVDLCPSNKNFEKTFFDALVKESPLSPVPVTFALTTLWIKWHKDEFEYLKNMAQQNLMKITWMNHSWTHPYTPGVAYNHNFLLSPGMDPQHEILDAEKSFIEAGVTPSKIGRAHV